MPTAHIQLARVSLLALLVAASLTACQKGGKAEADKNDAAAKPALLIAPEDLREVGKSGLIGAPVVSGAVMPARRADLRAEVAAVVLQVVKDNGERVRQGDLLVRLDATAIRDSLASAEEALRASTQSFEQTQRVLERARTLNQQGMTSMQGLEDAELRRKRRAVRAGGGQGARGQRAPADDAHRAACAL
jgi:membrane fusion protein (multidrug efflux system)